MKRAIFPLLPAPSVVPRSLYPPPGVVVGRASQLLPFQSTKVVSQLGGERRGGGRLDRFSYCGENARTRCEYLGMSGVPRH